jgi:2,3-bisphosphoglycerate-dependent phosphoglycerate mutase
MVATAATLIPDRAATSVRRVTQAHPTSTSPSTPSVPKDPPSGPPPPSPLDRAFLTNQPHVAQLVFVRHGQQEWPTGPRATPSDYVDPPLSETGRRQAHAVGDALAGDSLEAIYCSHLLRAHETALAIAAAQAAVVGHDVVPEVYPELREVEVYRDLPEGMTVREAIREPILRGVNERFVQERSWDVFPYTETSAEFRHRIITAVEGILSGHEGATVAIVCHGGVINAYFGHVLGLTEDMFFRPGHASTSRVLAGHGRRVVRTLNETHYLSAVDPALVTC